jgi:hypothetical protein
MNGVKPLKARNDYSTWRGCKNKTPYFSDEIIQAVIIKYKDKNLRPYLCDECGAKHLSSKPA